MPFRAPSAAGREPEDVAEDVAARVVRLPFFTDLPAEGQDRVVAGLEALPPEVAAASR